MLNKGDKVKNYILEKHLGEGSFGEVWLAKKQIELSDEGILVALKFLKYKPSKDETQEKFIEKVRREVATWIKASGHKNIVSVQDGFQFQTDTFVIVSDFADGGDLGSWLKSHGGKSPDLRKTVAIFCETLEGLQHLHTQTPEKIIHRDLKPDNILFKNGLPCITDFGVSRMSNTVSNSMVKGSSAGTPLYMSPEVLNNKPASRSMDIWSMGVMLYEMLSGNYPYFPQEGNIYSLILDIIQNPYQPLPDDVPFEFQKVVAKALEKDVNKRYQSAEEMRSALKKALKVWESSIERNKTIDDKVYQRQQKIKTLVLPNPIQNEPLLTEDWREIERQKRENEEKRLKIFQAEIQKRKVEEERKQKEETVFIKPKVSFLEFFKTWEFWKYNIAYLVCIPTLFLSTEWNNLPNSKLGIIFVIFIISIIIFLPFLIIGLITNTILSNTINKAYKTIHLTCYFLLFFFILAPQTYFRYLLLLTTITFLIIGFGIRNKQIYSLGLNTSIIMCFLYFIINFSIIVDLVIYNKSIDTIGFNTFFPSYLFSLASIVGLLGVRKFYQNSEMPRKANVFAFLSGGLIVLSIITVLITHISSGKQSQNQFSNSNKISNSSN